MSVYVTRDVWKFSESEHGARLTLLAIADSAHKEWGTCRLKQSTIAEMAKLEERAVRDAIRWLEAAVEIETRQAVRHRTRINVYRVLLGDYAAVTVDETDLGCRLLEPFSTPDEVASRKAAREAGTAADDRQILPVVNRGTSGKNCRDDRQNLPPSKEEPVLDPTSANALVPADAGERARVEEQIRWALTGQLGAKPATRSEHGMWGKAIAELLDAGATAADVVARCAAYRERWPQMALTPIALVRHWSTLGADVEGASSPIEKWVEQEAWKLDPEHAREILEARAQLTDEERAGYQARVDELRAQAHAAREAAA